MSYDDVKKRKGKGKRMWLQVDNKFQQVKIKDLNNLNNVDMFTTSVGGGKAFAAEQKIRELKTRIARYLAKRKKLRDKLFVGEKAFVLAKRIRKKPGPGKFYKQSVQNKLF